MSKEGRVRIFISSLLPRMPSSSMFRTSRESTCRVEPNNIYEEVFYVNNVFGSGLTLIWSINFLQVIVIFEYLFQPFRFAVYSNIRQLVLTGRSMRLVSNLLFKAIDVENLRILWFTAGLTGRKGGCRSKSGWSISKHDAWFNFRTLLTINTSSTFSKLYCQGIVQWTLHKCSLNSLIEAHTVHDE